MTRAIDPVLLAAPPAIDPERALGIAGEAFGIEAAVVRDLGSERDRALMLVDSSGADVAVMKISNTAEDPATLDMEAEAVLHAARVDPGLPLAIPRQTRDELRRFALDTPAGTCHVRCYDILPGRGRSDPRDLSDAAFVGWGETTARIGRALRGFMHPAAVRTMLWDVQHAAQTRDFLPDIRDADQRAIVERTLDRFEVVVAPIWPTLRAQVIHADLTTDNALVDEAGRISGIVDFGDMSHSALITDIASALDSIVSDRPAGDLLRLIRLYLDGYERITPLDDDELRLTGDLLATRAAITIAISSWRSAQGLEDATFAERYNAAVARTITALEGLGYEAVARRLAGSPASGRGPAGGVAPAETGRLIARRAEVLGPALEPLSYATPLHLARGDGTWLIDVDGRRYLDAYNNVPSVGHGHPRVTSAIARAARRLNTNLRYLHDDAIELAERLVATMPEGLDTVLFVNSGSEANDLAWRLATTATGARGGLCTAFAYHGISDAIAPLSPESWPGGRQPEHVETWAPSDALRGTDLDGTAFEAALGRLRDRGVAPAAVILDGALTSDGYPVPEPALVRGWTAAARDAGALWIADEVQGGHGRTGVGLWSFERFGIVPDVVTLGKPMGNGHPVGAVITRRDLVRHFAEETVFFSTFGGNPVAAAASLAVLDVIADERLVARAADTGEQLRAAIRAAAVDAGPAGACVAEVRGLGLATGVEICAADGSLVPDRAAASTIREGLRDRGVLVGTAGAHGNVLKVRPPLVFSPDEVPIFVDAFRAVLAALDRRA